MTDRARLLTLLAGAAEMPIPERDVVEAHELMTDRVAAVMARDPREGDRPSERQTPRRPSAGRRSAQRAPGPDMHWTAVGLEQKPGQRTVDSDLPEGIRRVEGGGFEIEGDEDDDQNIRGTTGIDGLATEDDAAALDLDDVALLLRANQLLRGVKHPFAHLFVDEAQDLSPMKLSVLIGAHAGPPERRRSRWPATPRSGSSSTTASATGAPCSATSALATSPSSPCASPTARRARS